MKSVFFEDKIYQPTKIVCVGRNYVEHIEELNNEIPDDIVLFIKPNSAISEDIINREALQYEGELSFIIEDSKIAGIGFGLDMTLRALQSKLKAKSLPWEKSKAFDNSAVFSKFIKYSNIENLSYQLLINGEIRQKADISLMIYKPQITLIETLKYFSLEDGDIIMSGTPKGVGEFKSGDIFICQIFDDKKLILEHSWISK